MLFLSFDQVSNVSRQGHNRDLTIQVLFFLWSSCIAKTAFPGDGPPTPLMDEEALR